MHIFTFRQLFWFVICTSAVAIWSFQGRFCRRSEQSGGSSRSGLSWFSQWESRRRSMFTRRKKGERNKEKFSLLIGFENTNVKLTVSTVSILETEIFYADKYSNGSILNQSRIRSLKNYQVICGVIFLFEKKNLKNIFLEREECYCVVCVNIVLLLFSYVQFCPEVTEVIAKGICLLSCDIPFFRERLRVSNETFRLYLSWVTTKSALRVKEISCL